MRTEEEIRKALARARHAVENWAKGGDVLMVASLVPILSVLEWVLGADNNYAELQRECEEFETNIERAKRQ